MGVVEDRLDRFVSRTVDMERAFQDQIVTETRSGMENVLQRIRATPWERDIAKSRIEFETLSAESLTQVYAVDERQVSASKAAERPTCVAPNLATFEERNIVGNSDQSEKTTEIIQPLLCTLESGVYRKQFHSASEKGVGDDKLDIYAFDNLDASDLCDSELAEHQSKCNILPEWPNCYGARGRETFIAPPTDSIINSTTRRVAHQIECEPVESDIEVTEAHRLFLADELLSAGQGVIEEFDYPPVPKQHSMCQSSSSRCAEKRGIDIDESEVISSQALRRKYLDREQTEEHSRVLYTSSPQNPDSGHIDINSSFRQGGLNEDELEQQQSLEQQSEGRLENDIRFVSHCKVMKDHENGSEVKFGTTAQNIEHQMNGKVERDPCVLVGNYNNLDVLEDEVLEKTMGWFPVEESCNEGNDPSLSVRWILDEPPTAADLPHLESLLEISPSKFWSPEPESGKRTSVHFGYLCRSESSQSPHSIQYFLNDSPTSSPEVTRTIFGGVPGSIISSKEPMHHCSQKRPDVHGAIQKIYSPCMDTAIPWTWRESLETSMKSPPLGSGRKYAQVQICVPQMSPAFSEDKRRKLTSREQNMVSTSNQDHAHEETGWVSDISSDGTVHRLMSQHGKNLVVDFLKVGSTTQEWIEAMRNDTELGDTFVPPSSKLWVQVENPTMLSDNMRVEFSAGLSDKKGMNALSALELQIPQGNRLTGTADALLKPFTSQEKPLDELQAHKPCKRRRDAESLPLSDISNHPNLAARLRGSLHEKLESQLEFPNTVLELVSKERPVSEQCPQNLAPGNIPWSTPGVPRVSRKRSSRVTTPKDTRPRVSNVLIDDNMLQAAADSPKKDYYTCKRGKKIPKSSIKELQTFPRNVKLRILMPDPASDRENDIMELTSREGRKVKSPILTKAVKPLRLIKTTPAKDYPWTRVRMTPKSNTVVKCEKNIEESGTGAERHEVKGNSLSKESPDIEANKMAVLRSSKYRGVTRHRHTGRFEAHLWDNSKVKLGLARRGRQVYLGAYTDEEQAARAHDLAALKYWGPGVHTNFPPSLYEEELTTMKNLTKEDYILLLRRKSPGFTRGISKYRGVTRHHQEGRWEARIGRHSGAKYHYLGTYDTEEEAAVAYDRAAVLHRGPNAVTNFDISNYIKRKPKNPKIEISLSPPQL